MDVIFETSSILKSIYDSALKKLIEQNKVFSQQQVLNNALNTLNNIEDESIINAESEAWKKLYPQALIIIVSIAEQLFKDTFEELIAKNLEKLSVLDEKPIKFKELRDKSFNFSREDWIELAVKTIYGDNNPTERINFQNVISIKEIFNKYFDISLDISDDLQKEIHFFYQVRHLIIHNSSKVDSRFIKNLAKAGITKSFVQNEKILVCKEDYENCKNAFLTYFEMLENSININ